MTLYEITHNLKYILNTDDAINLIKNKILLNIVKCEELPLDIILIIKHNYLNLMKNILNENKLNLIKKYSQEIGYNDEYLYYYKPIKLHVSTFSTYENINEFTIKSCGFYNCNTNNIFIVNLEEQLKIINSFYYNEISSEKINEFFKNYNIFKTLYYTSEFLDKCKISDSINKLLSDYNISEEEIEHNDIEEFLKTKEEIMIKKKEFDNLYDYKKSQIEFVNYISVLSEEIITISYNLKSSFFDNDMIKKVGKSSLNIVSGDGFYHTINICLLDNNDYYFVDIKSQNIIRKIDVIKEPLMEWCLLVNFIECHISMKLPIPTDINLNKQITVYLGVKDKIMKQYKPINENIDEFIKIWSTGKLLIYEI